MNQIIPVRFSFAVTIFVCMASLISCTRNKQIADDEQSPENRSAYSEIDKQEEYDARMESHERKIILEAIGHLPCGLVGLTYDEVVKKIGNPDRSFEGMYGRPNDELIPSRYEAGEFQSIVYVRDSGAPYVLIYTEGDVSSCVQAQWLPIGSQF